MPEKNNCQQRFGFETNEYVVYPTHGVGRIVAIEEQEITGHKLELFVINFEKDEIICAFRRRRPKRRHAETVGRSRFSRALDTLRGRARIKRTMCERRAQEYEAKINSGDLVTIAEVVRDLFRSDAQPEQSYSERQLYEAALDRMAREIAAAMDVDEIDRDPEGC